jgi:hypothetical protein
LCQQALADGRYACQLAGIIGAVGPPPNPLPANLVNRAGRREPASVMPDGSTATPDVTGLSSLGLPDSE